MASFFSNFDAVSGLNLTAEQIELLNKPLLGETRGLSTPPVFAPEPGGPTSVARTLTFTAVEDCTLRNLVSMPTQYLGSYQSVRDRSSQLFLGQITIAGTGPDVGTYVDGVGIPGDLFSLENLTTAPQINYRLDAGDTVSIDIFVPSSSEQAPYNWVFTYDTGQDSSVKPTRFIGGPTNPGAVLGITCTTFATGTITITAASVNPGDRIALYSILADSVGSQDAGGFLEAQPGGGPSSWDSTIVGITAIRDAILAAFQDVGNPWQDWWSFTDDGGSSDRILVTRLTPGSVGNTDRFVLNIGSFATFSPSTGTLAGALSEDTTIPLSSPTVDTTIDRIYAGFYNLGYLGYGYLTSTIVGAPPDFQELRVNASPAPISPTPFDPWIARKRPIHTNLALTAGDALEADVRNHFGSAAVVLILTGTAT